jgi:inosine-uridine nucleoside N-ribohydrolase
LPSEKEFMPVGTAERIIIDCDPGHDDMAAILLAARHPAITIEAITTVCGNASIEKTTDNALRIVSGCGLSAPVHQGAASPLLHRYDFPAAFHGPTGLGSVGSVLPAADRRPERSNAVEAIITRVESSPGEVSIVAIGPMTNLAIALAMRPDLAEKIKQVVFMGGSPSVGNVTPVAEFNIWADAEAARIVFRSGVKLAMFGLNVTNGALIRPQDIAAIRAAGGEDNAVADILAYYCARNEAFAKGEQPGAPVHDACAVAFLIDPSLFEMAPRRGDVVTTAGAQYGRTLIGHPIDCHTHDAGAGQIDLAIAIDAARVATLVTEGLVWGARRLSRNPAATAF